MESNKCGGAFLDFAKFLCYNDLKFTISILIRRTVMPDIKEYKCPACGAPLRYNVYSQRMVCGFCANTYDLEYIRSQFNETAGEKPDDFDWIRYSKNEKESDEAQQIVEYSCPSCGGSIITFSKRTKSKCPFCEHDLVISKNFQGDIRPDKVIPFTRSVFDFANAYWGYIANSKYIPREFKDRDLNKRIVGRYIPIWLYNCSCKTEGEGSSNHEFEIKDYPIPGSEFDYNAFYEIEPFNYDEAEGFTESCLIGFYAGKYTVSADEAINKANEEIKKLCSEKNDCYEHENNLKESTDTECIISDQKLAYYLVPVWIMKVKYKSEEYTFAMNGQTGEFSGGELFLEYRRMGDEKEKRCSAINKKALRYFLLLTCIYILLFLLILINALDRFMQDDGSFIAGFSALDLWFNSLKIVSVIFSLIYAVKIIKANPFRFGNTIRFPSHIRTIKDFVRDERKTASAADADKNDDKPNCPSDGLI